MKRLYTTITILFLLACAANAQKRTIYGLVLDAETKDSIARTTVRIKGTDKGTMATDNGYYKIDIPDDSTAVLIFSHVSYAPLEVRVGNKSLIDVELTMNRPSLEDVEVVAYQVIRKASVMASISSVSYSRFDRKRTEPMPQLSTNDYSAIDDNGFKAAATNPLSTFSSDVDKASYSLVRYHIKDGTFPPKDAVRTEELINYFGYSYSSPTNGKPIAIYTEAATCPWNEQHYLLKVGLQAKKIEKENLPPSNLVFLIDVSGSMDGANRLDLVKSSFKQLADELRPQDHVAIVVYAGAAGLVLPSTPGSKKQKIKSAIDKLYAGGSTAGGEGIKLAYDVAVKSFIQGGNNRVIIATDGDFNVGVSSDAELQRLIEEKRKTGVYLSVLGYGMGNYKDNKLETLADKGNGNYAYINDAEEANRILVKEFGGTLFTIAKDVKLQVEFNPAYIQGYRLIGYENRLLNNEDFKDDKKDAGDMGVGHTVTALYELIPVGLETQWLKPTDSLKYQTQAPALKPSNNELLTVSVRYKEPDGEQSSMIQESVKNNVLSFSAASDNFRFAAAVASFGMLLRNSEYKQNSSYDSVMAIAKQAKGSDDEGERSEFIKLVRKAEQLQDKAVVED